MHPARQWPSPGSVLAVLLATALASLGSAPVGGAAAPPTNPPWVETAKLLGSELSDSAQSGASVAVSGQTAVVGAGAEDNERGANAGAVYVFESSGHLSSPWRQTARLLSVHTVAGDGFGGSKGLGGGVAISGDTMVVGAPWANSTGNAYVFGRAGSSWLEVARIEPVGSSPNAAFGGAVAIDGDTIVVGAHNEAGGGAVYIFERDLGGANNWGLAAKPSPSVHGGSDNFGRDVDVSGDVVVAGAAYLNLGAASGGAFIFERDHGGAGAWGETEAVFAGVVPGVSWLGASVAASGDMAIIAGGTKVGSSYDGDRVLILERQASGAWDLVATLLPGDGILGFGQDANIDVDGDTIVVGNSRDSSRDYQAGSAYVFEKDPGGAGTWSQVAKPTSETAVFDHEFGNAVAVSGDAVVVGAPGDDDAAPSASNPDSGAAYVFAPCGFAFDREGAVFGMEGGKTYVSLVTASRCRWSATTDSEWIDIQSRPVRTGPGRIGVTAHASSSSEARFGSVTVGDAVFAVSQQSSTCSYTVYPTEFGFGHYSGIQQVMVRTADGCPWSVSVNDRWIDLLSAATGSGDGSVFFGADGNDDTSARSGTLTVAGAEVAVHQDGVPEGFFAITPTRATFTARGGLGRVQVAVGGPKDWAAVSDSPWLIVLSGARGEGPGAVIYAVSPNRTSRDRVGTLSIASLRFEVTQTAVGEDRRDP